MKSDTEIREDVISELRWDLQISEPKAIGLAVADGEVTLTGHVWSHAEKLAAAQATERVNGVEAIANDLKIRLSGTPRDDSDITQAIAWIHSSSVTLVPASHLRRSSWRSCSTRPPQIP